MYRCTLMGLFDSLLPVAWLYEPGRREPAGSKDAIDLLISGPRCFKYVLYESGSTSTRK
jgi:hypothetical protein